MSCSFFTAISLSLLSDPESFDQPCSEPTGFASRDSSGPRANKSSAPGEGDKTHRRVPLVCSRRDRSRPISHCDSSPATTTLQTNRERARREKVAKSASFSPANDQLSAHATQFPINSRCCFLRSAISVCVSNVLNRENSYRRRLDRK